MKVNRMANENGPTLDFGALHPREAKCETVEHMRLVNTLCALDMVER